MSRSTMLLWALVILFAGFAIWLVTTGRLQEMADLIVAGYFNFVQNIVDNLRK